MIRTSHWAIAIVLVAVGPVRADFVPPDYWQPVRLAALWPESLSRQTPHPAVVRVVAPERGALSLGSGTLVDANDTHGLVVTNWHVVKDAQGPIEVVFPGGFRSRGDVIRMDREWDLASLLIARPPGIEPVRVSSAAPRPGERLSIAGYGSGNYKMQSGQCTQYLAPGVNRPFEIVEVSAAARQGDSGGPILNGRGELAGVLFGEGRGRTSGSYAGRVHDFLQLTAMDLQRMPAANIAATPTRRASEGAADAGMQNAAAARFQGGISEAESRTQLAKVDREAVEQAADYESPSPRVAARAQPSRQWDGHSPRPLVIAPPNYKPHEGNNRSDGKKASSRAPGIWFVWGEELKSVLAIFGLAAIGLQLLQWLAAARR